MSDLRFDQAGLDTPSGLKRAVVPVRKAIVRILRPMLVQMSDALQSFSSRIDATERRLAELEGRHETHNEQLQATISFGWDYVATVRRLTAIEDQLAQVLAHQQTRDADGQMTLPFVDTAPSAMAS